MVELGHASRAPIRSMATAWSSPWHSCPIFINGHNQQMNKELCPLSACYRVLSVSELSHVTEFIRQWRSNPRICGQPSFMDSVLVVPNTECRSTYMTLLHMAYCPWQFHSLVRQVGAQWMHPNFLPVIGLRLHARLAPTPLTHHQVLMLLGMWVRTETTTTCRVCEKLPNFYLGPRNN